MKKPRVLIIAYYTPPLAMGGVQRATKLAKYLPRFGWQPIVLTVKPITYYAYDTSLLKDLKDIPLFRAESLDPARLLRIAHKQMIPAGRPTRSIANRLVRTLLPIDSKSPWIPFAYELGKRIVRALRPALVFSTAPPFSSHVVGLLLKKKFNLPLVLDFRDPFLDIAAPTALHRWLDNRIFERLKRYSDGFVAVTGKVAAALGIPAVIIENGFDPDDFKVAPRPRDARFTIGYMGALIERERTMVSFIRALERLEGVVLKIAGYVDPRLIAPVRNKVEFYGYLDHRSAIALIKSCDLLWLSTVERTGVLPPPITGKFFEYLAAGKPILATVSTDTEIALYLNEYAAGIVVPPEPDAIYRAISALRAGRWTTTPKSVARFSRPEQAARLAQLFDKTAEIV